VAMEFDVENANMNTVVDLLTKAGQNENYFTDMMEHIPKEHPVYYSMKIAGMSQDEARASIFMTLGSHVAVFSSPKIAHFTARNDFTFEDTQTHKSIIYVKIKMPENPYAQMSGIFFEQMIDQLYTIAEKHAETKGETEPR